MELFVSIIGIDAIVVVFGVFGGEGCEAFFFGSFGVAEFDEVWGVVFGRFWYCGFAAFVEVFEETLEVELHAGEADVDVLLFVEFVENDVFAVVDTGVGFAF